MAIVVETGLGVSGANSYVSVADARVWASSRGITLPVTDAEVEVLLLKAVDVVESFRARYSGKKTSVSNPLQWPRTGAQLDGVEIASDAIPLEVIYAQVQLACDANQIGDLQPLGTGQEVVREKIDVIETQYAERGSGSVLPQLNKAMAFLEPLFTSFGGGFVPTLRV